MPGSSGEPRIQSLANPAAPPEWKIFWDVEVASGIALVSLSLAPDFHKGRDNSVGRASDFQNTPEVMSFISMWKEVAHAKSLQ